MIKRKSFFALSLCCMTQVMADSSVIQIPEGKITDYHCVHPDITPAAGPRVIDGIDMFIAGDYLYWTAREDNLEYATTGLSNNPDLTVSSGQTKNPSFKYRSGFKATLGFNFGHDFWDTLFTYTWFQSNNNKSTLQGGYGSGLSPTFSPEIILDIADYFNEAHTSWGLHFNSIDWELGRNCYLSKYLSLRPFVGLKGSWQTQTFNNRYEGVINDTNFTYYNNNRLSYSGIGIRSGFNMSWHLSESWSLFGNLALSALWNSFDNHRKDHYSIAQGSDIYPVKIKSTPFSVSPVMELMLGVRKDVWCFEDRLHFGAEAGWEEQIWWDMNKITQNLGLARGGNLYLQGLTARLRMDF